MTGSKLRAALVALALLQLASLATLASLYREVGALRERIIPHDVKRLMAWTQRYAEKAWLAARAGDWDGARWYARQVQRMAELAAEERVADANGEVGIEMAATLGAVTGDLVAAARAGDAARFERLYGAMLAACNACHVRTEHAFVRIRVPTSDGRHWNQQFGADQAISR